MEQQNAAETNDRTAELQEELTVLKQTHDAFFSLQADVFNPDQVEAVNEKYDPALEAYRAAVADFNDGSDEVAGDRWQSKEIRNAFDVAQIDQYERTFGHVFSSFFKYTKATENQVEGRMYDEVHARTQPPQMKLTVEEDNFDLYDAEPFTAEEREKLQVVQDRIAHWNNVLNPPGKTAYSFIRILEFEPSSDGELHQHGRQTETPYGQTLGNRISLSQRQAFDMQSGMKFYRRLLQISDQNIKEIVDHEVFHQFDILFPVKGKRIKGARRDTFDSAPPLSGGMQIDIENAPAITKEHQAIFYHFFSEKNFLSSVGGHPGTDHYETFATFHSGLMHLGHKPGSENMETIFQRFLVDHKDEVIDVFQGTQTPTKGKPAPDPTKLRTGTIKAARSKFRVMYTGMLRRAKSNLMAHEGKILPPQKRMYGVMMANITKGEAAMKEWEKVR